MRERDTTAWARTAGHADLPRVSSDTDLALPSFRRLAHGLARLARLRCPHCGIGPVLNKWKVDVRERCPACNFKYERTDESYFSGAMFFNLMIMEAIFAVALVGYMLIVWPDVNWDMFTYVAAGGMLALGLIMQPLGKAFWLSLDVMIRPVTDDELACRTRKTS